MTNVMSKGIPLCSAPLLLALLGCSSDPRAAREPEPGQKEPVAATQSPAEAKPAVAIPAGTVLRVRIDEALDTSRNRPGDRFTADLEAPVVLDGKPIIPKGTRFHGQVVSASSSGRLKGRAVLALKLESFELNGQTYRVETNSVSRVSSAHKKRNIALIGGGSGVGALIGGIAGGGKGALIGAGAGAAAGTAGAAATGKKDARLPAESVVSFKLVSPVQVRG